jgi:hypothetical protein
LEHDGGEVEAKKPPIVSLPLPHHHVPKEFLLFREKFEVTHKICPKKLQSVRRLSDGWKR